MPVGILLLHCSRQLKHNMTPALSMNLTCRITQMTLLTIKLVVLQCQATDALNMHALSGELPVANAI